MKQSKRALYKEDAMAAMIDVAIQDVAASGLIAHGLDLLTFEQIKALIPVIRRISKGLPRPNFSSLL